MRTEDIVGVSFFALLIPSIVVVISASRSSLPPPRQALQRAWGLAMISGAFLAFGLVNYQLIHNSPRPVVEGNIWDVRDLFSTRPQSNSSTFMITDATGHAVLIRCKYSGPGLREGERARVRYVAYNQNLLEMEMLSGPFQQWQLKESSGEQGCWGWVAIGLVCGFFANRQFARSRQPQAIAS